MIAVFTFRVADLIAGITESDQWEWHGPCKAEIETGHVIAELQIEPLSGGHIATNLQALDLRTEPHKHSEALTWEQELSTAQANGTDDAMLLSFDPKRAAYYVNIGLRPLRYELFRTFITLHFGSPNLNGRMICIVPEFAHPSHSGAKALTEAEFRQGRPLLAITDIGFVFGSKPLP